MSKIRAALAAIITAGALTLTALAAAPAGATATRHGGISPAITCDQFRACFWSNTDYTGNLDQEGGPAGSWQTIPTANRGSTVNKFTQSTLWLYAVSGSAAGTFQCIPAGSRKVNNDQRGRWYKDVRSGSACMLIPPAPPSSIASRARTTAVHRLTGWTPEQLGVYLAFQRARHALGNAYRVHCTGFHRNISTRRHPLRYERITCTISHRRGFMYPQARSAASSR